MAVGEFTLLREYLEAAGSKPVISRGLLFHDNELNAMFVDAAVLQRDEAGLRRYAPLAEETAVRDGHSLYQAVAHRAWGVLYRLQGEYALSEARLYQALELFIGLETRWQIGRTFYELAELAREQVNLSKAKLNYSLALDSFEQIGAKPDAARTRQVLDSF